MKTILALLAIPLAAFAPLLPLTYDGGKTFVNGTKLTAGQVHKITAVTAAGPVTFQRDGVTVKKDSAAPFDFEWTPTVIGSHLFRAQASNGQWAEVTFNVVAVSPTPTSTPTPTPIPTATASPSPSPSLTAQWDPTQGHSYRIYVGRSSGDYFLWFDAGAGPTCKLALDLALEPGTHYFALTAVNAAGESGKKEIKYP